ncbi:hypothetical protein QPK87_15930 [Kamptonema cortianum]|nr:hypothetical protein [Kamptonema cortianum]
MTPLLKRLFTVDEFQRMADVGILTERDRVELIEGEIMVLQYLVCQFNNYSHQKQRIIVERRMSNPE